MFDKIWKASSDNKKTYVVSSWSPFVKIAGTYAGTESQSLEMGIS